MADNSPTQKLAHGKKVKGSQACTWYNRHWRLSEESSQGRDKNGCCNIRRAGMKDGRY